MPKMDATVNVTGTDILCHFIFDSNFIPAIQAKYRPSIKYRANTINLGAKIIFDSIKYASSLLTKDKKYEIMQIIRNGIKIITTQGIAFIMIFFIFLSDISP